MLTDGQIASGELTTNSLEELLKVTGGGSYRAHSDHSNSSTEDEPSPGEQVKAHIFRTRHSCMAISSAQLTFHHLCSRQKWSGLETVL